MPHAACGYSNDRAHDLQEIPDFPDEMMRDDERIESVIVSSGSDQVP
jgi:hypothetical protein